MKSKRFLMTAVMLPMLVFPLFAQAQRFEWAKGYESAHEANYINGTVVDSVGNLYFTGVFQYNPTWDDTLDFIDDSIAPYVGTSGPCFIIAKITPEGEMAWKKTIITSGGKGNLPLALRMVGDTAIVCMVEYTPVKYTPAGAWHENCYFLDTLIQDFDGNPFAFDRTFGFYGCNAFLMFDFDGNLIEQHYLGITYTDSLGVDDTMTSALLGKQHKVWPIRKGSFDIDESGNIYIVRDAFDFNNLTSKPSHAKFWVDGRLVGVTATQPNRQIGIPQLLKFSPHFDTLLADCFTYQKRTIAGDGWTGVSSDIRVDKYSNVYTMTWIRPTYNQATQEKEDVTFVVDSARGISCFVGSEVAEKTLVTIHDSSLNLKDIIFYDDSLMNGYIYFNDPVGMDFDYDSNLFFIATNCETAWTDTTVGLSYHGTFLRTNNNVFVASFRMNTFPPVLHSYTKPFSKTKSASRRKYSYGNLIAKKGRIMVQARYNSPVILPDRELRYPSNYWNSDGLVMFDYLGNTIDVIDYNTWTNTDIENKTGPMVLRDSVLYVTYSAVSTMHFGDVTYYGRNSSPVIARYVDTALMRAYMARNTVGIVPQPEVPETEIAVYPNPAKERLTVVLPEQCKTPRLEVFSVDGRLMFSATGTILDVSHIPTGMYMLRTLTTKNVYTTRFVVGR